ncbi:MAG: site-specific DNA-methyltransferase [bacterium]|nr:site-specific DNA-methyltransferase [bacterium]
MASQAPGADGQPAGGMSAAGRLVCCDNLVLLRELPDGCCDLIYLDPPFGTGKRRTGASADTQRPSRNNPTGFDDPGNGGPSGMVAELRPRLEHIHRVLSERGCLYVHLDWRTVHYVKILLDELFGADNFLNEIVWSYRTGGRATRWFARKHDTILLYARCVKNHTFNVLREGRYRTQGLNVDERGRPYKVTQRGRLYFHSDGPALTDVWDIPFLSTVANERNGYPTQKPEALLERIIRAGSNPGDLVADLYCGSGTTLAVAKQLGRRYLGCDVNAEAIEITRRRLDRVAAAIAGADKR